MGRSSGSEKYVEADGCRRSWVFILQTLGSLLTGSLSPLSVSHVTSCYNQCFLLQDAFLKHSSITKCWVYT